jgi:hypothetical protein
MNAAQEAGGIVALRRELARAERILREKARSEAVRMAAAERIAWREAREKCLQLERIRRNAKARLSAICNGSPERFSGERTLAEMALNGVETWEMRDSAAYTVISFARLLDRLRYLRGGTDREAVVAETLKRGGVYDDRGHFTEILLR